MTQLESEPAQAKLVVFDDFYVAHYRGLVRVAFILTGSRSAAEELAQEAMLRVFRDWAKVADLDAPAAWARRVLVNLATSRGRRLAAEARALTRLHRGEPVAASDEAAALWEAVRRLPKREAQAIALYYAGDLPVAEIAASMEIPDGTVKTLLHRARRRLADALGDSIDEEETP